MDTVEDDQMEIVNKNDSNGNDTEQKNDNVTGQETEVNETDDDMNVEDDKVIEVNDDDDEKTKEEDDDDDEKTKEDDGDDDEVKDIINEEDIEFYESDFDLENLEGQDPAEIEKKKQELLEKRDKLIAYLESKGADPEELLHLGLDDQASTSTPSPSSRQKRKRTSKRLSESPTSNYSLRDKTKRSKPVRKTPKKETIETIPEEVKTSPGDSRRERTTWTLSENKQLLKILESGNTDTQYIYKEMSKLPGRRKSIGHIRNKKSNLLQKAALKGTSMIDILREDILKSEELEGKSRRQSREIETYANDIVNNAPISNEEFNELKNLIISGLLENQRQIALLRREFAHYRGLPTPPDVLEILSDDEQDDLIQEQSKVTTPNSGKKTLVIKKSKQTPESEQVTAD